MNQKEFISNDPKIGDEVVILYKNNRSNVKIKDFFYYNKQRSTTIKTNKINEIIEYIQTIENNNLICCGIIIDRSLYGETDFSYHYIEKMIKSIDSFNEEILII